MKKEIKIKCPAKINLTLEILNKREDGFHNIQSVMQTISLFDILTIKIEESDNFEIKLSGTSDEIPYDERNLVYKAAMLFAEEIKKANCLISVHIEKNIPIAAGLAGGSTDAAGVLFGLNKLFDDVLSNEKLHEICANLGSDLNFCLDGGCKLATSRGEILQDLPFQEFNLSLIKPENLGISAKEAYTKLSKIKNKLNLDMTSQLVEALKSGGADIQTFLYNDLELAVIDDYAELQRIKNSYPKSIMSGSGSTFFVLDEVDTFEQSYWVKSGLKSIPFGVSVV